MKYVTKRVASFFLATVMCLSLFGAVSALYECTDYASDREQLVSFNVSLTKGQHKIKLVRKKITSGQNNLMYIPFITMEKAASQKQVVSADKYLTRIELVAPLTLEANTAETFQFTVPESGNYAFYANRNTNYADGSITATVTPKNGDPITVCTNASWNGATSGPKPVARIGSGTSGAVALQANTEYTLSVTSTAGFTTSYIDVVRTDVNLNGKTVIPTYYYSKINQYSDHFLNNADYAGWAETYIPQNFSDYAVVGQKTNTFAATVKRSPVSPLLSNDGGYMEFTINAPAEDTYVFSVCARVYSGENTAYPEDVYFSVDSGSQTSVSYAPADWDHVVQMLRYRVKLTEGTHTLRFERKKIAQQNSLMFIPFITAEPAKPEAQMYFGSVDNNNKTQYVQKGNLIATITPNGAIAVGEEYMAHFAIYNNDNQMVRIASQIGTLSTETISLPIDNFIPETGKSYRAKAFLLNNNLQGDCFELAQETTVANVTDFSVTVPEGREPVILQLTDPQIIDASQERTPERLSSALDTYYAKENMEARCFKYLRDTINKTNPDLILVTGDIIYGEFDDAGTSLTAFIEFMESFNIPWAPIFGNHENESKKGADWQSEQLENAENCLFRQRNLTGNGNYTVGVYQGDALKRVFFMIDSNGCVGMSSESYANGHSKKTIGFGDDQIAWFSDVGRVINAISPETKISFAFHIPPKNITEGYEKYGYTSDKTQFQVIDIDKHANKAASDFGLIGGVVTSVCDENKTAYNAMKAIGMDSLFVGHLHEQSASVVYDGVRFQFGQKSSTYDQTNYVDASGKIHFSYVDAGMPLVGGTVMELSETDGSISNAYIYLCDEE